VTKSRQKLNQYKELLQSLKSWLLLSLKSWLLKQRLRLIRLRLLRLNIQRQLLLPPKRGAPELPLTLMLLLAALVTTLALLINRTRH
jgi:hypothetical protein